MFFTWSVSETITELTKNPVYIVALVLLLVGLMVILRSGKIKFTPRLLTNVGLSIALSVILNMIPLSPPLPQGGNVTALSMLPIFLVALAYGSEVGFLAGFVFGLINMILGGYIIHPIQMLLDYPLAFMALGVAGAFPKKASLGILLGGTLRFICHVISGVVFFSEFAGETNPWIYSVLYNGPIVYIELIIIIIVLAIIPINRLLKAMNRQSPEVKLFG